MNTPKFGQVYSVSPGLVQLYAQDRKAFAAVARNLVDLPGEIDSDRFSVVHHRRENKDYLLTNEQDLEGDFLCGAHSGFVLKTQERRTKTEEAYMNDLIYAYTNPKTVRHIDLQA